MNARAARAHMTIGDVLGRLRGEFPDITISKIRFLESEGLIEPERTPSGYRKFGSSDVERLRFILAAQRDHYLPLRVIKEQLAACDGEAPPPLTRRDAGRDAGRDREVGRGRLVGETQGTRRAPRTLVAADTTAEEPDVRLTRRQLIDGAGIDGTTLAQLEEFGLVRPIGRQYDGTALVIARTAAALGTFGFEARHLRAIKAAAEREIGLIEQVVAPLLRQRSPGAHTRAEETAREIAGLAMKLHEALVSTGLRESLDG